MTILLHQGSRILVQGITGRVGRSSMREMRAYGANVVAGSTTADGITEVEGVPVFRGVASACAETAIDVSIVFVPAVGALGPVIEALDSGISLVVFPGDGLPVRDAIEMRAAAKSNGAIFLGPNTPGLISPGQSKAGFMPSFCYAPGKLGVISRSGSLSYESCYRLTSAGLGQSTVVGIGGDPVKGLTAAEAIKLFHEDPATNAIVYLGEIGGNDEHDIVAYAAKRDAKPIAALIVGSSAPIGKTMGHAAALIRSRLDTPDSKLKVMQQAGVAATGTLSKFVDTVREALNGAR
jgi:succinyl-CoA synthetase alpha subunit